MKAIEQDPPRQPIHVVYGGAHLFKATLVEDFRRHATKLLDDYAPTAQALGEIFSLPLPLAETINERLRQKLSREPLEAYHIDFEDGFGPRSDEERRNQATRVGSVLGQALAVGIALPPFLGLRIKALAHPSALTTLELFLSALTAHPGGRLPGTFSIVLPKVTGEAEVARLASALGQLETRYQLRPGILAIELMVETPAALIGADGRIPLRAWFEAAAGRCRAFHLGAYDLTAAAEVSAAAQGLDHPLCQFARQILQTAVASTSAWLVDGATNVLPLVKHRTEPLTAAAAQENKAAIAHAWQLHASNVQNALYQGYYQGWDLHPGQLVARYVALYRFFLLALPAAAARLQNFVAQAARASHVGSIFDDEASAQGLINFFLRGLSSGALSAAEISQSGLSISELGQRSFAAIVAARAERR